MSEDKSKTARSAASKKTEPEAVPLKKPMRYKGAMRGKGYPVVLSDRRRARLSVKKYV